MTKITMSACLYFAALIVPAVCGKTANLVSEFRSDTLVAGYSDNPSRLIREKFKQAGVQHEILYHGRSSGNIYVVFKSSYLTHGEVTSGICGSGIESSVDWFKIHKGALLDSTQILFESCLQNITGNIETKEKGTIVVIMEQPTGGIVRKFTFNPKSPFKGFVETPWLAPFRNSKSTSVKHND